MSEYNLEDKIVESAKKSQEFVVEKRRDFHRHPEVKFEEKRTAEIVETFLKDWGYETKRAAGTGVIGVLECGGVGGRIVALRADIDALNVEEENDVPYKSVISGKMHACGHDAHTAMLLGAAKLISDLRDSFNGTVKLVFQPGEEGGAGAKKVLEEGHLDDVDAIFGIHVWVEVPSGVLATRKGPMMASSDGFEIRIAGKGGHAAHPHLANDPTAPLQTYITHFINWFPGQSFPRVITLPMVKASDGYNVIPESVEIRGTLRTFDSNLRDRLMKRMQSIAERYAEGWVVRLPLGFLRAPYPPLVNTQALWIL